jgi:hypothetical protein
MSTLHRSQPLSLKQSATISLAKHQIILETELRALPPSLKEYLKYSMMGLAYVGRVDTWPSWVAPFWIATWGEEHFNTHKDKEVYLCRLCIDKSTCTKPFFYDPRLKIVYKFPDSYEPLCAFCRKSTNMAVYC